MQNHQLAESGPSFAKTGPEPDYSEDALMSSHPFIPDLGAKIDLLLRSDRSEIRTNSALYRALGITSDYLSRMKSGGRPLTEEKFLRLCDLFKLTQKDWFVDLEIFGKQLGFSRKEIAHIAGRPLPGIDFASRLKDKTMIDSLFDVIAGYWETFYFSVSTTKKQVVSRDLLIVRSVNEDGFIDCEIHDGSFSYSGWCFPINNHLYFILEKSKLFTEIIVYITNIPEREPPRLYGIILCLSGGVEETASYPSAAKVAFRYIGQVEDVRKKYNINEEENTEDFLKNEIPKYINPENEEDPEMQEIFSVISNTVRENTIPFALRMSI